MLRRPGLRGTLGVLALLSLSLLGAPAAFAQDTDAEAIANGLRGFASTLDRLGGFEAFGQPLPLVEKTPQDILDLDGIFGLSLGLLPTSFPDLSQLESAIENADFTTPGGVTVDFQNVQIQPQGKFVDLELDIQISRPLGDEELDVQISSGPVQARLAGGGVPLDLVWRLDGLKFQFDTANVDAETNFYLTYDGMPPRITLPISADAGTSFDANLGFTQVQVTPHVAFDIDLEAQLNDPDSDGRITLDELTMTAVEDLFTVGFACDAMPDIDAMLTLTADIISGESKINYADDCLADGIDAPVISWNGIREFSNISPTVVLQGISQLAAAIGASQQAGSPALPFISQSLSEIVRLGQPVLDFVETYGLAAISCGQINEDPPRGNLLDLEPNEEVFCQAIALDEPTSLTWGISTGGTGTIESNANEVGTVGPNPGELAVFRADAQGRIPDIELTFTDGLGTHTVKRRFLSVQEMIVALAEVGGFEEVADLLTYNDANDTLVFHLRKSFMPAPAVGLGFDFADQLKNETNLAGLAPSSTATLEVMPGEVSIDVRFGVILADDPDPTIPETPDPSDDPIFKDRFFIQGKPGGGPEVELADLSANANVDLKGMIGFVEISAIGDDDPETEAPNGTGFSLGPAVADQPVLALNLDLPGIGDDNPDGGDITPEIPDAIRFRQLLRELERVDPTVNLSMHGGLQVAADIAAAKLTGGVGLWWDITDFQNIGSPTVMVYDDFAEQLKIFDIQPALGGTHTGADGSQIGGIDRLVDSSQNGFAGAELINATLRNLTDGSQCIVQPGSVDGGGITCELSGGRENNWRTGDRYEVGGNPEAMLAVILDTLDRILTTFEERGVLDDEIPLIGKTPAQLVSTLREVRDELLEFRSQQPLAQVICSRIDPSTGEAAVDQPLIGLEPGDEIICQGVRLTEDPAAIEWSIEGASASVAANPNLLATVAKIGSTPTDYVRFQIPDGGSLGDDFKITLTLTDVDQMVHPVFFPIMPLTLQNLSELLACHLGIPAESLRIALEDLPAPGQASPDGTTDLVFGLTYGFCTDGNTDSELACEDADRKIDRPAAALRLGLPEDLGGSELIGLDATDPQIYLELRAEAGLEMAIPLSSSFTPEAVRITDASRLDIRSAAAVGDLEIEGNVGPLMLTLDGEAEVGLRFSAAALADDAEDDSSQGLTYALSGANSYTNAVQATFASLDEARMCGMVTTTQVKGSGSHGGANDATNLLDAAGGFDETFVGLKLRNTKDGSSCTVTAASASTDDMMGDPEPIDTLECTLTGGKTNVWASGDGYEVEEPKDDIDLEGDVCARLALKLEGVPLGELGFRIEELNGNVPRRQDDPLEDLPGWFLTSPRGLLDNVNVRDLDLALLFQVLPRLLENLASALQSAGSLPLLGDGLEDLGNILDNLNMEVVEPLTMELLALVSTTVGETEMEIRDFIWDNLPQPGRDLIADTNGDDMGDASDIVVTGFCDTMGTECEDDAKITDLQDLRVRLVLGQGGEPDPNANGALMGDGPLSFPMPLDFGVPGLPLKTSGSLIAQFGWRLPLEIGVNRTAGPYLVASDADSCPDTAAESGTALRLGASLGIGDNQTEDCSVDNNSLTEIPGYSDTRCIAGQIGFLGAYLRDGDDGDTEDDSDDPTRFDLFAFTKLVSNGDSEVVPLARIIGGAGLDAGLIADADVNFRFRTGLAGEAAEDLPSILGTFHLAADWSFPDPNDENGLKRLDFEDLYLDVGQFFDKLVGPAVRETQNVTKPLQPVIDTVRSPLPVVSDLSNAVGQGPITLLTLIELRNGKESTRLIRNIFELIDFINSLPADGNGTVLIPLGPALKSTNSAPGAFSIDLAEVGSGPLLPSESGRLIDPTTMQSGNASTLVSETVPGDGKAFGVTGLSFPFLDNSSQIFALLMGQDIVLVRYDAGTLRATAGFQYTYGPFFVGPVPVSVALGGAATFQARFAMGYDTSGIRKALEGGSVLGGVVDGIFIDDLDSNGCDVPEIALIGEVYAGAGVDLGLIAAGISGGIRMTTALNLDDRPETDGRLHIEEISNKLSNPICLFVVEGKLEAFLKAWVRVGFEWFKKKWDWELVSVTLLEFEIKCSAPPPMTAEVGPDRLILNVGSASRREARGYQTDRIDERVTIRQIDDRLWSLTSFGITQTYGDGGEFAIPGSGQVTIEVDAGDGKDEITAEEGVKRVPGPDGIMGTDDDADVVVAFTANLQVCGGADRDEIKAGEGADILYGDSGGSWCADSGEDGNDRIQGGGNADEIHGEGGLDNLSGEGGHDTILAGAGNDIVTGGPGEDEIFGGEGDDNLAGGWPASQRGGTDPEDPAVDMDDLVVGGLGDDAIEGGFGDDLLYGDFQTDGDPLPKARGSLTPVKAALLKATVVCDPGGANGGVDRIVGGEGDDQIWGGTNPDGTHESLGGEEGDDFICGGGGADLIDGDDTVATTLDGNDLLHGGPGHDGVWGRGGNDRMFGGSENDEVFGEDGDDDLSGGAGRDLLRGGIGNDVVVGDDAVLAVVTPTQRGSALVAPLDAGFLLSSVQRGTEVVAQGAVEDCFLEGDESTVPRFGTAAGNADCIFGGDGHDLLFGDSGHDVILGEDGDDFVEGGVGSDRLRGGRGSDVVYGHRRLGDTLWRAPAPSVSSTVLADRDEIFGDSGLDDLYGGPDADLLRGGIDDDYLEGNQDAVAEGDRLFGDGGQDDLIGGSSVASTADDFGDTLFGNSGQDVMIGDNGQIERPDPLDQNAFDGSIVRRVRLLDLESRGGNDEMHGNQHNDRMWGGLGTDTMFGDQGDDYLEGNPGADELYGNAGQDDLVGGTGRTDLLTGRTVINDRASAEDGRADGADVLYGGDGPDADDLDGDFDVLAGDNAIIDRVLDGSGGWLRNTFNDGVRRSVWLFDIATADAPASGSAFGDDDLFGQAADDVLYGQGGDDEIDAGSGEDVAMGNDGADVIAGGTGNDDLYGGTGVINADPAGGTNGRLDGGDQIDGGDGFDVIAGDNAVLARVLVSGAWVKNTFDDGIQHERRILLDIDSPEVGVAGADVINGDADNDLIYGQGAADTLHGNDGDDLVEGNADGDDIFGDAGQDDLIGGTTEMAVTDGADHVRGGGEADVVLGDNGEAPRALDGNGEWRIDPNTGSVVRDVHLFDVATLTNPVDGSLSAGDTLEGEDGTDRLYGQGGDDDIHAGEGFDVVEGNAGADEIFGDGGEDDLIGGGSANDGIIRVTSIGDGLLDGDDLIHGGDEGDVIAGDNARIIRPTSGGGLWSIDPNVDDAIRAIRLFDVETTGLPADLAVHGEDRLFGEGGSDRIFGEGADDEIRGGLGVDIAEGNHGADLIFGDEGEDDLIGGGSANDGVISTVSIGNGLLDGDDEIHGGDEGDVVTGDNARLTRLTGVGGIWEVDPNSDDVLRQVQLFDVEVVGAFVDPATSGSDHLFGENGRDLMFGQGNADPLDDDGDGSSSEDPVDGIDNDHDGRESLASLGYDCADGIDNDGDQLADLLDPDCALAVDEDAGGDILMGGPGIDYLEGNHGGDLILGEADEDDILGGSSAGDGLIGGGVPPAGLADGDDTIRGGDEDDQVVADNAVIERPTDPSTGLWLRHTGFAYDFAVRVTTMSTVPEPEGAFGDDYVEGNPGQDEIYGQQGHDHLEGNFGDDSLVGDLGQVTTTIEDGSRMRTIQTNMPFHEEVIFAAGVLTRETELFSFEDGDGAEGFDTLLGGDGADNLRGGPGDDLMNGDGDGLATGVCETPFDDPEPATSDRDQLFGGDGNDALWGGRGRDHLFGGYGDDFLDVQPRLARAATNQRPAAPADPPEWFTWGMPDNFHGLDVLYGGWDQDALQGDVGGPGPQEGDRLLDWAGGYNIFYVCPGAFGEGMITRAQSPDVDRFLHDLAEADGAVVPKAAGRSGFREVAYVQHNETRFNSNPPHPDHPGHFTCACEEVTVPDAPICLPKGDGCVDDSECCSGKCTGKPGAQTCK